MTIIGIHTPETRAESNISSVREHVKENKMLYPVAVDNASANWRAWGNQFWPAVYLIDKAGYVRYRWDGELNWNNANGQAIIARKIEELLAEGK